MLGLPFRVDTENEREGVRYEVGKSGFGGDRRKSQQGR